MHWFELDFLVLAIEHVEDIIRNCKQGIGLRSKSYHIKISALAFPQSINLNLWQFVLFWVNPEVLSEMLDALFLVKELLNTPHTTQLYNFSWTLLLWFLFLVDLLLEVIQIWALPLCLVDLLCGILMLVLWLLLFLHLSAFLIIIKLILC